MKKNTCWYAATHLVILDSILVSNYMKSPRLIIYNPRSTKYGEANTIKKF